MQEGAHRSKTYVMLIQDMYRGSQTKVLRAAGESGSFNVDVGLHQGSALSPVLFIILVDVALKDTYYTYFLGWDRVSER